MQQENKSCRIKYLNFPIKNLKIIRFLNFSTPENKFSLDTRLFIFLSIQQKLKYCEVLR